MATIRGDDADNVLIGTDQADTIIGEGGNDRLVGNAGDDSLDGGSGNDVLTGGAGSDTLVGGGGRDILFGGEENPDVVSGYLNFEPWMEQQFGFRPPNPFNRNLAPDVDPDILSGGRIVVAGYNDTVLGTPDYVHWTYLGSPGGITLQNYWGGWVQGSNFADTFADVRYVLGMGGDDQIITSTSEFQVHYVDGGDGNDLIEVRSQGLDQYYYPTIFGGAGDDTIIAPKVSETGPQSGYADGGDGNDTIYGGGSGGAGDDRIDASEYRSAAIAGDDGHDELTGSNFDDNIVGGSGADAITGGSGDDILSADRQHGFDNFREVDEINAGAGNDLIFCGYGDIVNGGDGFDTVALSYVGATEGIDGDTQILHTGQPLVAGAGTFQNVERFADLALTQYNDRMVIGDQADPATVRSLDGDDHLVGQRVSVTMYGGNGNDLLVGSIVGDFIYGENGNDRIMGYTGADEMWGGAGSDVFFFAVETAIDKIHDFQVGSDKIDLTGVDADESVAGYQPLRFIGNAEFSGAAGEVRVYQATNSDYYVAADVNGDRTADLLINLGAAQVGSGDFIF